MTNTSRPNPIREFASEIIHVFHEPAANPDAEACELARSLLLQAAGMLLVLAYLVDKEGDGNG